MATQREAAIFDFFEANYSLLFTAVLTVRDDWERQAREFDPAGTLGQLCQQQVAAWADLHAKITELADMLD